MAGQSGRFVKRLERQMADAAAAQDYERAARLRDDIGALTRATEKQAVVLADGTDADVIALAEDQLEAAVQVFHVRGGRVRGQRGFVVDKVEELTTGELVGQFLAQAYGDDDPDAELEVDRRMTPGAGVTLRGTDDVPREVLVPALPPDWEVLQSWLCDLRGTNVQIRVPQRGDKRALLETVERNAMSAFALHKTKRASDLTARSLALSELQDALELAEAPLRIECFDVSHVQGTNVVASMVVFEDGLARKSEYRRFAVRGTDGNDDTASMREVVRRRFSRYLDERSETGQLDVADGHVDALPAQRGGVDPETGRPRRFAYPPQLVVVDGGAPQVAAAQAALDELGIDDVALVGLAKRLEEVWVPGSEDPVILPRTSEGLYLLQRVRDEAHRFAIAYHRQKRSKTMTASALDGIPGLGETRRKALLRHFGSLKRLKAATVDEVMEVPGIGKRTAEAVLQAVAAPAAPGTATGRAGLRPRHRRGGRMSTPHAAAAGLQLVVVTGLSGAGRSTAAKCLEDLGWFVVDNLPPSLLPTMVDLGSRSQGAVGRIAVVVDVRSRAFSSDLRTALDDISRLGLRPRVLFLEAADDALVRRFESVRRPHPLQGDGRLVDGIVREKELLRDLRGSADLVLDSTSLNVHELRGKIAAASATPPTGPGCA
jgi:excinuclease ABC subunit C